MRDELARIKALEDELASLVRYLKSLPTHPMTYHAIAHAETVLESAIEPRKEILTGRVLNPVGIANIQATLLTDNTLCLNTNRVTDQRIANVQREDIYKMLCNGVEIEMKP